MTRPRQQAEKALERDQDHASSGEISDPVDPQHRDAGNGCGIEALIGDCFQVPQKKIADTAITTILERIMQMMRPLRPNSEDQGLDPDMRIFAEGDNRTMKVSHTKKLP